MVNENVILQLTDAGTTRSCAIRIDAADAALNLEALLDKRIRRASPEALAREGRVGVESREALGEMQDYVYRCDDSGRLGGMYWGVEFWQERGELLLDDIPAAEPVTIGEKTASVIDVRIDRSGGGYERNWAGFHRRRWDRHAGEFAGYVEDAIERALGRERAREALDLAAPRDELDIIHALARRVWEADFENYSRFRGRKLTFKTGDETALNIIAGRGGVCAEKVQALKFLTDHYGLASEYVLAGPDARLPAPERRLRELLDTHDFRFSKRFMRYWQHLALLYTVGDAALLVDATNGNIPFLFMRGREAEELLGYESKRPVRVRMALREEEYYYHRVSQDIVEDLLYAMEGWIPYVDLMQAFDNELGLCITPDRLVAPIVYQTEREFDTMRRQYERECSDAGLACETTEAWAFEGPEGAAFAEEEPAKAAYIMESYDRLLDRCDEAHGAEHEAGLATIRLRS